MAGANRPRLLPPRTAATSRAPRSARTGARRHRRQRRDGADLGARSGRSLHILSGHNGSVSERRLQPRRQARRHRRERRDGADLGRRQRPQPAHLPAAAPTVSAAPPSALTASWSSPPATTGRRGLGGRERPQPAAPSRPRRASSGRRVQPGRAGSSSPPATTGRRICGTSRAAARLRALGGLHRASSSAAFSPDGKLVVTAGDDGTARIWGDASERPRLHTSADTAAVDSAAFSPDGSRRDRRRRRDGADLVDVASGRLPAHPPRPHRLRLSRALFSPDGEARRHRRRRRDGADLGSRAAAAAAPWPQRGSSKRRVQPGREARRHRERRRDGADLGRRERPQPAHPQRPRRPVGSAVFSPDGKLVVTASDDGTARIWDVASGRSLHTLSGHTDYV